MMAVFANLIMCVQAVAALSGFNDLRPAYVTVTDPRCMHTILTLTYVNYTYFDI